MLLLAETLLLNQWNRLGQDDQGILEDLHSPSSIQMDLNPQWDREPDGGKTLTEKKIGHRGDLPKSYHGRKWG